MVECKGCGAVFPNDDYLVGGYCGATPCQEKRKNKLKRKKLKKSCKTGRDASCSFLPSCCGCYRFYLV